MKNDTTQKPGYETYWGQMTNFLKMNDFEYNSIKEEWEHLNLFEQKDAQEHYKKILIENKIIETNNGKEYLKIKSNYISSKINSLITDETDCIVELGSGWGRNVISNSFINPNWKIYGGELTEEGQNSLSHFIKKYNLSNVNSFNFNWCDVSNFYNLFKNKNYKEIIIYSVHSIEQVSYLDIEQFKKILSLPFKIKFFHVEPCSWQWLPPRKINGWNENFKIILDELENNQLITNLTTNPNGCKLNMMGSGAEGISITYEKNIK